MTTNKLFYTLAFCLLSTLGFSQIGEIPIVGTTSTGMQIKPEVSEENAYNDDNTNYWTGNPDTAALVSITFDLLCIHDLTEIGINFWKADERTTTFSIALADDAAGPFTTVIDNQTSAEMDVTVDSLQLFSLADLSARYIQFVGIGNSSESSNWTSVANVNIYGVLDADCVSSVSNLKDQGVSIFPVPVSNGVLSISSTNKTLGFIEIFDVVGKQMIRTDGNGSYSKQIDVSQLNKGVYFLKLENTGIAKFIVK